MPEATFITFNEIKQSPDYESFWEIKSIHTNLPIGRIKLLDNQPLFVGYRETVFEKVCLKDIADFMATLVDNSALSGHIPSQFEFEFEQKKSKTSVWKIKAKKSQVCFGKVYWYNAWRCYGFYPNYGYHFSREALLQIAEFLSAEDSRRKEAAKLARLEKAGLANN